jgi:hypothetical protein
VRRDAQLFPFKEMVAAIAAGFNRRTTTGAVPWRLNLPAQKKYK